MKLLNKKIEVLVNYKGFSVGSHLDRDYIARACGFLSSQEVVEVNLFFDKYDLNIVYESAGDQRIQDEDTKKIAKKLGVKERHVKDVLSDANRCKLSELEDIELFFSITDHFPNILWDQSWYEGYITLKDKSGEVLIEGFESNLGLDGVQSSVSQIQKNYESQDFSDLILWLLEE